MTGRKAAERRAVGEWGTFELRGEPAQSEAVACAVGNALEMVDRVLYAGRLELVGRVLRRLPKAELSAHDELNNAVREVGIDIGKVSDALSELFGPGSYRDPVRALSDCAWWSILKQLTTDGKWRHAMDAHLEVVKLLTEVPWGDEPAAVALLDESMGNLGVLDAIEMVTRLG